MDIILAYWFELSSNSVLMVCVCVREGEKGEGRGGDGERGERGRGRGGRGRILEQDIGSFELFLNFS